MFGMFGGPKIPAPKPEVLEKHLPDGVSEEMGLYAWREGWIDGRDGSPYRYLEEHSELQALYSDGFDTGEKEKAIIKEFMDTRAEREGGGKLALEKVREVAPKPPAHIVYIKRGLRFCEDNRPALEGFCYLAVGMLAAQTLVSRALGEATA
jgi:hypothetical protein